MRKFRRMERGKGETLEVLVRQQHTRIKRYIVMKEREADLIHHHVDEVDDEYESLPGFRFHPTDEELVGFYLRRKVEKKRLSIDIIRQIDIYKYDPWDLSKLSTIGIGDKEWYFFCLRGRKYRNSVRPNRVTDLGFWKATGIDKKIFFPVGTNNCIGLKKSLVYYLGRAGKGNKTDWMMHEFRLPPKSSCSDPIHSDESHEAENWTICRIFKRNASSKKSNTQAWKDSSSSHSPTPTDHASSNSSSIIDTMDQSGDHNCINQFTSSSLVHPNEDTQQQWNTDQTAITGDVPLENISEFNGLMNFTGFDELEDTNWDEIGRILEFSMDPTLVCL